MLFNVRRFFLADGAAYQVGFTRCIAGKFVKNLNDLLLVNYDSVSFRENRLQGIMFIFNFLFPMQTTNIVGNIFQRPWPIERNGGDDMLKEVRSHLGQHAAHARTFHLEDASHFAAGEQFERLLGYFAFKGNIGQRILDVMAFFDQPPGFTHDRKRAEAEKVNLEQTDRL